MLDSIFTGLGVGCGRLWGPLSVPTTARDGSGGSLCSSGQCMPALPPIPFFFFFLPQLPFLLTLDPGLAHLKGSWIQALFSEGPGCGGSFSGLSGPLYVLRWSLSPCAWQLVHLHVWQGATCKKKLCLYHLCPLLRRKSRCSMDP